MSLSEEFSEALTKFENLALPALNVLAGYRTDKGQIAALFIAEMLEVGLNATELCVGCSTQQLVLIGQALEKALHREQARFEKAIDKDNIDEAQIYDLELAFVHARQTLIKYQRVYRYMERTLIYLSEFIYASKLHKRYTL